MIKGTGVAMITPFTGESMDVDYEAIEWLVEHLIAGGVDFLVPCGTTGESPTLSHDEQNRIIARTVEVARGRVPVVAGTGSNSTREAVDMTRKAKEAGADACMVVTPYYNRPSERGVIQHFEEIAAVNLPIIIYDIPKRTGIGMTAQTISWLASENESIVGLKWASQDHDQLTRLLMNRPGGLSIFAGNDQDTFTSMTLGADGCISVLGNLIPNSISRLVRNLSEGRIEEARKQHMMMWPLMQAMFLDTNPIPVKYAMRAAHGDWIKNDSLRLPLTDLKGFHAGIINEILERHSLIEKK